MHIAAPYPFTANGIKLFHWHIQNKIYVLPQERNKLTFISDAAILLLKYVTDLICKLLIIS